MGNFAATERVGGLATLSSQVRTYRPGDENLIIELSNRSLAPYAGWVPRTLENWRWSILRRPGIRTTDLLLLESGGKLGAYAVLSQDGSVLDFAVDPDQHRKTRRSYIKEMVDALEECARSRDCDTLMFSLPASDHALDEALREATDRRNSCSLSRSGTTSVELEPDIVAILKASFGEQ